MIYVGYQGIGKSSIAGKNNCIDLESGNFWVDGIRNDEWYKIYCNIAEHLSNQGFNVFMSSHSVVRDELNKRNIDFTCIFPSVELKEQWIKRLEDRYNQTQKEKDYKALMNAKECYEKNIRNLMYENNCIEIMEIDYDLLNVIEEKE